MLPRAAISRKNASTKERGKCRLPPIWKSKILKFGRHDGFQIVRLDRVDHIDV